jgi:chemotaxis response regulator CheB
MRHAGARTLAQDEATSAVYGMPKAAIALDAAEQVLPLERLAATALRLARTLQTLL